MSRGPMEGPKECDLMGLKITGKQVESDCHVKQCQVSYKLYHLMSFSISCIIQEIDQLKICLREDENRINDELIRFSYFDEKMERSIRRIKYLQGEVAKEKPPQLPIRSISWTAGFLKLTEEHPRTLVQVELGTSMKRCHNRLEFEYLQQVQEELSSSLKSGQKPIHGTQELGHVMKSLVDRIQHGSNNRANEQKIFHEIKKIQETIEIYTAPKDTSTERERAAYMQHELKLMINSVEAMKRDHKEHTAKMNRLKAERDQVEKNIRCIQRVLEKVYAKRNRVYKSAYKHEGQMKDVESSYNEYQFLMRNAEELARKGNFVGLMQFLDMQVEEFMIRRQ